MTTTTHQQNALNHMRRAVQTAKIECHTLYKRKSSGPLNDYQHRDIQEMKMYAAQLNTEIESLWKLLEEL